MNLKVCIPLYIRENSIIVISTKTEIFSLGKWVNGFIYWPPGITNISQRANKTNGWFTESRIIFTWDSYLWWVVNRALFTSIFTRRKLVMGCFFSSTAFGLPGTWRHPRWKGRQWTPFSLRRTTDLCILATVLLITVLCGRVSQYSKMSFHWDHFLFYESWFSMKPTFLTWLPKKKAANMRVSVGSHEVTVVSRVEEIDHLDISLEASW